MSCADAEGTCYITTANLDGETNLKVFIISTNYYHIFGVQVDPPTTDITLPTKSVQKNELDLCTGQRLRVNSFIQKVGIH